VLILKKTSSHFKQPWGANDFVVLDAGRVIGRIMRQVYAPEGSLGFGR